MKRSQSRFFNLFSAIIFPILLVAFAAIYLYDIHFYRQLLAEDHLIEWLSFALLLVSGLLSLLIAIQIRKKTKEPVYYWFFLLFTLVCIFSALEEISWGQRIFGFELFGVFKLSDQQEINIHNVVQTKLPLKTKDITGLILFGYGVCLPWLARNRRVSSVLAKMHLAIPPLVLSWGFLLSALLMVDKPTGDEEEIGEFLLGLCLFLFMLVELANLPKRLQAIEESLVARSRAETRGPSLWRRLAEFDLGLFLARYGHWLAIGILGAGFLFYLQNLDAHIVESNEGSYLYAAWRIGEGEMPYRDLLTPQLPLFLYTGALLIKLFGPSVTTFHLLTIVLTILGAGCLYLAVRRFFGSGVGLLAMMAFLVHPDVFKVGWMYRPDPYMLFFSLAGLCLLVGADGWSRRRRWGLAGAGFLFGLGVLSKLFGVLPLGACAAFLGYRALRSTDGSRQARWRGAALDVLALLVPAGLVVGLVMGGFYWATPEVYGAVLGHHLMQGQGQSWGAILGKGLRFLWEYFFLYASILVFALPLAVWSFVRERGRRSLFAWYPVTVIAFLFLSRELWPRHLLYLVPAVCALFALALKPMLARREQGFLVLAVMGAVLIPWVLQDLRLAGEWDVEDWRLADYIAAHTAPNDYVLSDYSELNFYAQRRTTYSGASITGGAASSGQITGRRLIEEMEANDVKMVVLSTTGDADHKFLLDLDRFLNYVETHFRYQGTFRRYPFSYLVYVAPDLSPPQPPVDFEDKLALLSADLDGEEVPAGGIVGVRLRWQAQQAMTEDYSAFLHLKDKAGRLWSQDDSQLIDSHDEMTSEWLPDEIDAERYGLAIPQGAPPGEYQLVTGLYRLADLSRLNILGASGNPVGTDYVVGKLRVTRPAIPPAISELIIPHHLSADLGGTVRVLGYAGLDGATYQAGETIPLSLFWQALRDVPGDYLLRLELRDEEGHLAASQRFSPGNDDFATSQWRKGEIVEGRYDLLVDATASGGRYQLGLNWIEAATDQPLVGDDIVLGQVQVTKLEREFEVPPIAHPAPADLGERIALLGYDLEASQVKPGGTVHVTLYWQAKGRVETGYTVFTHLLDGEERIRGQWDSIPAGGTRPTTGWLPGEVIVDEYAIPVDSDAPPGDYFLEVGMYDPLTADRLPVFVEGSRVPGDRVLLTAVVVQ